MPPKAKQRWEPIRGLPSLLGVFSMLIQNRCQGGIRFPGQPSRHAVIKGRRDLRRVPVKGPPLAGGPAQSSIGRMGAVSAATFLMTVPTIVLFLLMQRRVMETMVYSGIKA